MIIVVILNFIGYTISKYFDLKLTVLIIDAFSIFYSISFIAQDMPILENDEEKLIKDLFKYFEIKTNGTFKLNYENITVEDDLYKALANLTTIKGIQKAMESFNKFINYDSKWTFLKSLSFINIMFLEELLKNKDFYNKDENLKIILASSFRNVKFLGNKDEISNLITLDNEKLKELNYLICDITLRIYEIYNQVNELQVFEEYFGDVLNILGSNLNSASENNKEFLNPEFFRLSFLNKLIFKRINSSSSDFYFLNMTFDSKNEIPYVFRIDNRYNLYLSIIIYSVVDEAYNNYKQMLKPINDFLSQKFIYGNETIDFKEHLNGIFDLISISELIDFLPMSLFLFKSTFIKEINIILYKYILNSWFELIIFKYYNEVTFNKEEMENMLNNLSKEDRIELAKVFNNWLVFQKNNLNLQFGFLSKFKPIPSDINNSVNQDFIKYIDYFKNNTLKENYIEKFYLTDEKFLLLSDSFKEELKELLNKLNFYDNELNLDKDGTFIAYKTPTYAESDLDYLGSHTCKILKNKINMILVENLKNIKVINNLEEIENKIDFINKGNEPRRSNNFSSINSSTNKSLLRKLIKIEVDDFLEYYDFYIWNKQGIKFNFNIEKIEKLNQQEVKETLIKYLNFKNKELYMINNGSEFPTIYLNENELKKYIENLHYKITYKYSIILDETNILHLK